MSQLVPPQGKHSANATRTAPAPPLFVRCSGTLSMEMPTDWHFKESYTLLSPDGQANLIASTEPLDPSVDAEYYATVQGDLLTTEFPDYEHIAYYEVPIHGMPGPVFYREFSWRPPEGEQVTQMQIYAVVPGGGRGITATGTAATAHFGRYRDALYRQMTSLVHANLGGRRLDTTPSIPRWS